MPFNPRNPGLDPSVPDDVTVIGALNLFIPESMFELFTVETNRYRDQFFAANPALKKNFNGDDMVRPITVPEMKTFFGIQVFAGVIRCTIFRELWYKESELLKSSLIARSMTYTRFRIIERFFHITNNEELPPTGTQEYKLARVQPVLQAVQKNCRDVYKANSKRLAIDEGCMGWKGHSSLRQYNPSKPNKYHIKSYKLVETQTGYLSGFFFHDTVSRTVNEIVLTLLARSRYGQGEGYSVYFDRFYSSPNLFNFLKKEWAFDITGTCLPNRKQFPQSLKARMSLEVGQCLTQHRRQMQVLWLCGGKIERMSSC